MGGATTQGRTDGNQMNSTTATKIGVGNINESGKKTYDFQNFQNKQYKTKQKGPLVLRPLEPLFDLGSKKTRTFFTDKVLSSDKSKKNIGYTKDEFSKLSSKKQEEVYKGYLDKRLSNTTDAYGNTLNTNSGGNDNNNQPILDIGKFPTGGGDVKPITPTNAEVTQAQSTDMSADQILLANNKKGRKQTILNNPDGLGSSTANTTKKTLGA
jgi:hypothetical protein